MRSVKYELVLSLCFDAENIIVLEFLKRDLYKELILKRKLEVYGTKDTIYNCLALELKNNPYARWKDRRWILNP